MKRIILSAALFLMIVGINQAQQMPLYSQYMLNGFLLNPGMTGNVDYIPLRLTVRQQWVGIDEAPSTQAISGHYLMNNKHFGVGGYLYNDMFGPMRQTGIQLSAAYHIPLGTDMKLGLGLGFRGFQFEFDETNAVIIDEGDPIINRAKQTAYAPDADFGAYLYDNEGKYFAGISATQLIELDMKIGNAEASSMVRHYYLMGGYKFKVSDAVDIEPSVLAKATERSPFNIDLNVKGYFKKNYWFGVSYRSDNDLIAVIGIKFDKFLFGYSFDYPFSNINNYSSGSHEIMIGFNIGEGANSGSSLL